MKRFIFILLSLGACTPTGWTQSPTPYNVLQVDTNNALAGNVPGVNFGTKWLQFSNGAGSGSVLTSDADGKAAWQTLSSNQIPTLDASKIGTGMLNTNRVPALDASKITTGTLNSNQIPALDGSKITTGVLNTNQIPNLDAGKITTGTLSGSVKTPGTNGLIVGASGTADTGFYLGNRDWQWYDPVAYFRPTNMAHGIVLDLVPNLANATNRTASHFDICDSDVQAYGAAQGEWLDFLINASGAGWLGVTSFAGTNRPLTLQPYGGNLGIGVGAQYVVPYFITAELDTNAGITSALINASTGGGAYSELRAQGVSAWGSLRQFGDAYNQLTNGGLYLPRQTVLSANAASSNGVVVSAEGLGAGVTLAAGQVPYVTLDHNGLVSLQGGLNVPNCIASVPAGYNTNMLVFTGAWRNPECNGVYWWSPSDHVYTNANGSAHYFLYALSYWGVWTVKAPTDYTTIVYYYGGTGSVTNLVGLTSVWIDKPTSATDIPAEVLLPSAYTSTLNANTVNANTLNLNGNANVNGEGFFNAIDLNYSLQGEQGSSIYADSIEAGEFTADDHATVGDLYVTSSLTAPDISASLLIVTNTAKLNCPTVIGPSNIVYTNGLVGIGGFPNTNSASYNVQLLGNVLAPNLTISGGATLNPGAWYAGSQANFNLQGWAGAVTNMIGFSIPSLTVYTYGTNLVAPRFTGDGGGLTNLNAWTKETITGSYFGPWTIGTRSVQLQGCGQTMTLGSWGDMVTPGWGAGYFSNLVVSTFMPMLPSTNVSFWIGTNVVTGSALTNGIPNTVASAITATLTGGGSLFAADNTHSVQLAGGTNQVVNLLYTVTTNTPSQTYSWSVEFWHRS